MFEPGDLVITLPGWDPIKADVVARVVDAQGNWLWIHTGEEGISLPQRACRKLSEHEIMERLQDV